MCKVLDHFLLFQTVKAVVVVWKPAVKAGQQEEDGNQPLMKQKRNHTNQTEHKKLVSWSSVFLQSGF